MWGRGILRRVDIARYDGKGLSVRLLHACTTIAVLQRGEGKGRAWRLGEGWIDMWDFGSLPLCFGVTKRNRPARIEFRRGFGGHGVPNVDQTCTYRLVARVLVKAVLFSG